MSQVAFSEVMPETAAAFGRVCGGIGIVIGGSYNSRILARGASPEATYDYDPAPEPVLRRVTEIARICADHGVAMADAALQFPLRHPSVVSVIPGGQSVAEMTANLAAAEAVIPAGLWDDLKAAGLLRKDAPT